MSRTQQPTSSPSLPRAETQLIDPSSWNGTPFHPGRHLHHTPSPKQHTHTRPLSPSKHATHQTHPTQEENNPVLYISHVPVFVHRLPLHIVLIAPSPTQPSPASKHRLNSPASPIHPSNPPLVANHSPNQKATLLPPVPSLPTFQARKENQARQKAAVGVVSNPVMCGLPHEAAPAHRLDSYNVFPLLLSADIQATYYTPHSPALPRSFSLPRERRRTG